ncbi:MAG: hypothetical protein LBC73_05150 [Oscillospiraceae bacterium]|jgi:hypothetical protein|nr:hypothetical protein [Oscillospiraceae bacterium]
MQPIVIPFIPTSLGRVEFTAGVMTGDRKTFKLVEFKLDSGSDFTTISCDDLEELGYSEEYLKSCPHHSTYASTASDDLVLPLQYISDVSIKFEDRELQGCRIFFALGTKLRSLFGSDILKYFNREINYDSCELRLIELKSKPILSVKEKPIRIYSIE